MYIQFSVLYKIEKKKTLFKINSFYETKHSTSFDSNCICSELFFILLFCILNLLTASIKSYHY